jgi:hypothetical protein
MKSFYATFHYKGTIIHSDYIDVNDERIIMEQADKMIKMTLRDGASLKQQIQVYENMIKSNIRKKFYKYPISKTDGMLGAMAIYALCRLKRLQLDDTTGCVITKRKARVRAEKRQVVQVV